MLELLVAASLGVSTPYLVRDIGRKPFASDPEGFTEHQGVGYFWASSAPAGRELWRSDGTRGGTWMVKDLRPGPSGTRSELLLSTPAGLFFAADDGQTGSELWITDGTRAGTRMVLDLNPGSRDGVSDKQMAWYGGALFFAGDDGNSGRELWRTDGSAAGTRLLKDACPGSCGGAGDPVATPGLLFFRGCDPGSGCELWSSDGQESGTVMVQDAEAGSRDGLGLLGARNTVYTGGLLFYPGLSSTSGRELWRSDGTAAGTFLIRDVSPGWPSGIPEAGNLSGFTWLVECLGGVAFIGSEVSTGDELWFADGTAGGARLVLDLNPGPGAGALGELLAWNSFVWMLGTDGSNRATLRASDGTASGTRDVAPGQSWGGGRYELAADASGVHFAAPGIATHQELWTSDGSAAGTRRIVEIPHGSIRNASIRGLTSLRGGLLFSAVDPTGERNPWFSDGTAAGTGLLKRIAAGASEAGGLGSLTSLGARVLLTETAGGARALWSSDATGPGTIELLRQAISGDLMERFVASAGTAYFVGNEGFSDEELWRSDGTRGGTARVTDLCPGGCSNLIEPLAPVGGGAYFRAYDLPTGVELWRTDGTASGTRPVADIAPGRPSSWPEYAASFGGLVLFVADDSTSGPEPWRSDGTAAGTFALGDLCPGACGSGVIGFSPVGSRALFATRDPASGDLELRVTDGSSTPPPILPGVLPRFAASDGIDAALIGGAALFAGEDPLGDEELWRSDGTPAGTFRVRDLLGADSSHPREFVEMGSVAYFATRADPAGEQLWRSDGSAAGTWPVARFPDGPIRHLTAAGAWLFFFARDAGAGEEPWLSDGSAAGTFRLADLNPGPLPSAQAYRPGLVAATDEHVLFLADDGVHGEELWAIDLARPLRVLLRDDQVGSLAPLAPPLETIFPMPVGLTRYLEGVLPGVEDPEAGLLGDASRPLVFYQLDGNGVLLAAESAAGTILFQF